MVLVIQSAVRPTKKVEDEVYMVHAYYLTQQFANPRATNFARHHAGMVWYIIYGMVWNGMNLFVKTNAMMADGSGVGRKAYHKTRLREKKKSTTTNSCRALND